MDAGGTPNVAPKSWLQMVAFEPPTLMLSGSKGGRTETDVLATGCFAVNIVDGSLVERTFACVQWRGEERIRRSDFRLVPASTIRAPLVDDCKAHLECRLVGTQEVGSGFVLFGEVVAASIRDDLLALEPRARYARLDQALFLEEGLYAAMDRARPATSESMSDHFIRYVILLTVERPQLFHEDLVRAHVAHLRRLEEQGRLELCGPFCDRKGGIVVLRGVSETEARAIAEADPFVSSGAETCELRKLEVSCRDNRHMGMG
ncbi:MAG: flavin reductase [Planctomycetes bacterium]|nr:flavin reductase [Planctomycetota bacterium]